MNDIISKIEDHLNISINRQKYLLIGNAFDKKSLFLYENGTDRPDIVVRIPMSRKAEKLCENEYNHLLYLNNIEISNIIAPYPLGVITYKGSNCYIQKTLFSNQMQNNLRTILKKPRAKDFKTVVNFLSIIYKKTKSKDNLKNKSYSHCWQQGDCWIGNLGLQNNSLVLYDLEYAVRNGYPLYDLLHFGLHYHVALNNVGKLGKSIRSGKFTKKLDDRIFDSIEKLFIANLIDGGSFTKLLKYAISTYTTNCKISKEDTMFLIKNYFEKFRGISDFKNNWEKEVYKKIL